MSSDPTPWNASAAILAEATARFSDGASARADTVTIRLLADAIEIFDVGASVPRRWSLRHVVPATAFRADGPDVLLRPKTQSPDAASLFIKDPAFLKALATAAPHLTSRAQRMRVAKPLIGLAAGLVALTAIGFYLGWSPARWVAASLPESARQTLGDAVVGQITSGHRQCTQPAGREALDALARRIGGRDVSRYKIMVVDWGLVNAFAAPGNRIVVTRGILEQASSADEIAGVLAHEIGHSIALDPETGLVRALGLTAIIELMSGGNSGTAANIGLLLTQLGYTRSAERRADETAMRLLKDAKVSPRGTAEFFRRLSAKDKAEKKDNLPFQDLNIFRSHPPSEERAVRFDGLKVEQPTPVITTEQWASLKAICTK